MSEEAAESATPTTEGVEATEGSDNGLTPDLSAEVAALRERLDAQETTEPEQSIPTDGLMDYLLGDGEDESDEGDVEPAQQGEQSEQDELLDTLNAYVNEGVQEAVRPVIEQIQAERNREKLEGLAAKYPDLKSPETLDAIGQDLGKLAESIGNPAVRTDPRLVEMAYMAHKARQHAAAERPATPTQGNVETNSVSQPDPGVSDEEAILKSIIGAASKSSDSRALLG